VFTFLTVQFYADGPSDPFGGTVAGLAGKGVSGLAAAVANANTFVDELLARLSNGNKPIEREEVA
jgi:hypothetical protein